MKESKWSACIFSLLYVAAFIISLWVKYQIEASKEKHHKGHGSIRQRAPSIGM